MDAMTKPSVSDCIITERLMLRPLSFEDSDAVFSIRSNAKIFWWRTPDTREMSDAWLKENLESRTSLAYMVFLLPNIDDNHGPTTPEIHQGATRDEVGWIGMTGAHAPPEIGYVFYPTAWGKGYATEALGAWIDMYWTRWPHGWEGLPVEDRDYLNAFTGPGGDSSNNVLRKCGFEWYADKKVIDARVGSKQEDDEVILQEFRLQRPSSKT